MSRLTKIREVASSSRSATIASFAPRQLLVFPWITGTVDLAHRVAAAPAAAVAAGRGLRRAAEQLPLVVARAYSVLDDVDILVSRMASTATRAARVIDAAGTTVAETDEVVAGAGQLEARVGELIERCQPLLRALIEIDPALVSETCELLTATRPLIRTATDLDADLTAQAAGVVGRWGPLLDQFDMILTPLLRERHDTVPARPDVASGRSLR